MPGPLVPVMHGQPAAGGARPACLEPESLQLRLMVAAGFLVLLVPATVARLTGWRWRPWPPGPQGYRSIVSEARAAADSYVPLAFLGS